MNFCCCGKPILPKVPATTKLCKGPCYDKPYQAGGADLKPKPIVLHCYQCSDSYQTSYQKPREPKCCYERPPEPKCCFNKQRESNCCNGKSSEPKCCQKKLPESKSYQTHESRCCHEKPKCCLKKASEPKCGQEKPRESKCCHEKPRGGEQKCCQKQQRLQKCCPIKAKQHSCCQENVKESPELCCYFVDTNNPMPHKKECVEYRWPGGNPEWRCPPTTQNEPIGVPKSPSHFANYLSDPTYTSKTPRRSGEVYPFTSNKYYSTRYNMKTKKATWYRVAKGYSGEEPPPCQQPPGYFYTPDWYSSVGGIPLSSAQGQANVQRQDSSCPSCARQKQCCCEC